MRPLHIAMTHTLVSELTPRFPFVYVIYSSVHTYMHMDLCLCPRSPQHPTPLLARQKPQGDAPDPEAGSSENGSSMDYDEDDLDLDGQPGTGGVASLNLDDVSSSSEEDDEDEDEDDHHGTGGGDGKQANVFAGVRDEGGVDAMVQEQIVQLDRQDEKARKGRGAAGLSELNRAREALRYSVSRSLRYCV